MNCLRSCCWLVHSLESRGSSFASGPPAACWFICWSPGDPCDSCLTVTRLLLAGLLAGIPAIHFSSWHSCHVLVRMLKPRRSTSAPGTSATRLFIRWRPRDRFQLSTLLPLDGSFTEVPDNSPLSHSVLPVLSLPYWSFQLCISL